MSQYDTIAIMGPTASGKTSKAVALARHLHGEIISGDSRQVYRGMDLGTGKDLEEYGEVSYHLIDIVPAGSKYDLYQYVRDFNKCYDDIRSRGVMPVICGGTGLYVETVISGVRLPEVPENPQLRNTLKGKTLEELTEILSAIKTLHNTTDVDTCQRAIRAIEIQSYYREHPEVAKVADRTSAKPLNALIVALDIPRDDRRQRITSRLQARLDSGMVEEVRGLIDSGIAPEDLIYYGLEYKFVTQYVLGIISFEEMKCKLEIAIHQFAKRQMTWLRGMERRGFHINWLPYDLSDNDFAGAVSDLM
ncbi:MAG: tRNA (adenosine(37)-N6)-dimethylallyltransferase MiaA [Muribaculaceae bacterium]|nr:tRNA (adenosine(37)-N6)-dimethylallyltransferase MiaA [Muribaculaceae bacterium]